MEALRSTVIIALAAILALGSANAEPKHRDNRDYVYRRQQAGAVTGTPILRHYIGRRQIDIYRNGLMFEKDNVVGIRR